MTRRGDTLLFDAPPTVAAWAAAGGKKESEGPLASAFDFVTQDAALGEQGCENGEQAESLLQRKAVELCLRKADIPRSKVDLAFAGDLQAQCTASNYTMRELGIPFAGVYGACSTMAETLGLAAVFAAGGMAERVLALTSSHFCAAERQFRTPLEYGAKRTPTAQWTATAAGACLVRAHGSAGVPVLSVTFGRVQDFAVHDINNMGAAMMPAAASTLLHYFSATGTSPQDFDAIFTGDLGEVGTALLHEQMAKEGLPLDNHKDCGCLLYDTNSQNVQAGGSGAAAPRAVSGNGRTDEPDYVFAGGEHPGHRPLCRAGRCGMSYVWAFVVGGSICVVGQLFIDYTKLSPARILTGYVVAGVILSAVGLYKPLADFAGAGASVPLLGFGHLLAQGVQNAVDECGLPGAFTGGLTAASGGIAASLIFGVLAALVGKSKDQN